MTKYRNYLVYSIVCFAVWAILLAVVVAKGKSSTPDTLLLVFGGWVIAWVSTTIARYIYPPPKRWLRVNTPTA